MMDIISKVVKANIFIYFKHCVDLNLSQDIISKGTIKCTFIHISIIFSKDLPIIYHMIEVVFPSKNTYKNTRSLY